MTIAERYNNMVNAGGSLVINTAPGRPTTLGYNDINTVTTGADTMTRAEIQAMFDAVMQGNRSVATDRAYNPVIGYDGGHQNPSIVKLAFGEKSKQEDNHQTISNKRKLDI